MQKVKLGEIASVTAGQGAPQNNEEFGKIGFSFVRAGNLYDLINGTQEKDLPKISDDVAKRLKLKLFPAGSVLFAKSGMSCLKGYVYALKSPCYVVNHLAVITPYKCQTNFLKYYFDFHKPNSLVKDKSYPSISLSDISNIELKLPTVAEQNIISDNLCRLDNLIKKRKKQIEKLDELVKSRFIEMFGAIGKKIEGWDYEPISCVCEINPKKSENKTLQNDTLISFVPMPAVTETGGIDVSETKLYKDVKNGFTYFCDNDVLFAKITPCMENGKGAIAKNLRNGIGFGSTEFHVLRPINGISNSEWIYFITVFIEFRLAAEKMMTGSAGQRRVPAMFFDKFKVAVPPIELQNKFAEFVEKVEKSKSAIKKSLSSLETLKKSLMQKYFG